MIQKGIWNPKYVEVLKRYETDIENLKVQLFECFFDEEKAKVIRDALKQIRQDQARILSLRDSLAYVTDIGYASMVKSQYLTACGLFRQDGSRIFDPDNIKEKTVLLDKIMIEINSNKINANCLRELSRTEPWRGIWSSCKGINVFGTPPVDWSDEQKMLASFGRMYDNIAEHPECPDSEVVQDDDSLDGWLIKERKKSERNKTQKKVDSMIGGKQSGAGEIFLVAPNQHEADKINDLNDVHGKMVKRSRAAFLKRNSGKEVSESQLPDVKQKLIMQANREMSQRFGK